MERSCGFDICPPLEPTTENRSLYANFITNLLAKYESRPTSSHTSSPSHTSSHTSTSPKHTRTRSRQTPNRPAQVVPAPNGAYIIFLIAGLPVVPYNSSLCQFFLRFSCKSEELAMDILWEVFEIAKRIFGKRVRWWDERLEGFEGIGIWTEDYIDDMHRSMMRALENGWVSYGGKHKTLRDFEEEAVEEKPKIPEKPLPEKPKVPEKPTQRIAARLSISGHNRRDSVITDGKRRDSGTVSPALLDRPAPIPRKSNDTASGSETLVSETTSLCTEKKGRSKLSECVLAIRSRRHRDDTDSIRKKSKANKRFLVP